MKNNHFVIFFFLGLALYFQSLFTVGFQYDDRSTILLNPFIRNLDLAQIWQNFNTRFLVGLSFAVNYFFSGLAVFPYHFFNVLVHVLNAFLVCRLADITLRLPYFDRTHLKGKEKEISLFAGLIFLCHPLQSEPVNFITQRFVLCATLFYLLSILFYVKTRTQKSIGYYIACVGSIICAMLSKEIAFTLPIMIIVYEIFFFGHNRLNKKQYCYLFGPILLTLLIIPCLLTITTRMTAPTARIAAVENNSNPVTYDHDRAGSVDITRAGGNTLKRSEYFFTQLNVLVTYLRLLVVPVNQNVMYDYPVSKTFWETKTIGSAGLLLMLLAALVFTFKRYRLFSFSILWFFLTLSVESSIIPIAHVIAEYRMYLAMFGCSVFFSVLTVSLFLKQEKIAVYILSGIVVIMCVLTWQRNQVWLTEKSFWEDIVRKSPLSARAHAGLGIVYLNSQENKKAIDHSLTAIELDPQNLMALITIGYAQFNLGEYEKSLKIFESVLAADPRNAVAYHGLGKCLVKLGHLSQAVDSFERAVKLDPTMQEAYPLIVIYAIKTNREPEILELINQLDDLGYRSMSEYMKSVYEGIKSSK